MSDNEKMEIRKESPLKLFERYASDNKGALLVIGVIGTVAALFLNLDSEVYGESLRDLQLLLLLFLFLGLLLLTLTTIQWFVENADSWFASLISLTSLLLTWRIARFIVENFRDELNQYLTLAMISIVIVVAAFLHDIKSKVEKGARKYTLHPLFSGLAAYVFMYTLVLFGDIYTAFIHEEHIGIPTFFEPTRNPIFWIIAVWITVLEFVLEYYHKNSKWMFILVSLPLIGIVLFFSIDVYFLIKY